MKRRTAELLSDGHTAYRVPDLQFDLLAIYVDHPRPKLDADGEIMDWLKSFVRELQKQARFANTCAEVERLHRPWCVLQRQCSGHERGGGGGGGITFSRAFAAKLHSAASKHACVMHKPGPYGDWEKRVA